DSKKSKIRYQLDRQFAKVNKIKIKQFFCNLSYYNINSYNNKFYVMINNDVYEIELKQGIYDSFELASILTTKLQDIHEKFEVSIIPNQYKFVFGNIEKKFTIRFPTQQIMDTLEFSYDLLYDSNEFISDKLYYLNFTRYLRLHIKEREYNYYIPVSSIVGSSLYYEDDDIYILDKEFTNVLTLTIEIYDKYNQILDFNNMDN